MKILIDINHPAHVHYFRNFINIMEAKGHTFVIINRDSKIINELLDHYEIKHRIRNKRPSKIGLFRTITYLLGIIKADIIESIKAKPDIYIGFGSFPCTITAFLFRKPVVLLDDTEHNSINHLLNKPFRPITLTPFYFNKFLGNNQIYFKAYVEQLYLHSQYYKPNSNVLKELGLYESDYALVRYISYDARHDSKVKPLSIEFKKQLVLEISKKMKVIVSCEYDQIDEFYKPFHINISPEKMHDVIAHATFFLTEGATMASEACMLGVPYLYINPLQDLGNIKEQVKTYPKLAAQSAYEDKILEILHEKIENRIAPETRLEIRNSIEQLTINPTTFFVWFIENYPISVKTLKENPDFQNSFV